MPEFLIAPTERPPISDLGRTSSLPETLGSDILWEGGKGLVGVQRKTVMDLVASVRDGRLGKELQQMQSLAARFLIVEGQMNFSSDGQLMTQHTKWSIQQQRGVELTVQQYGIFILYTMNPLGTCSLVEYLYHWTFDPANYDPHAVTSLVSRSNPPKNGWGNVDDKAYAVHFLSGIPHVGPVLAARIYEHYKTLPVAWMTTKEELMKVPGLGRQTANAMWRSMHAPLGDEWWIPWLAGLIDGEGTIYLRPHGKKNSGCYILVVVVYSTNLEILERIHDLTKVGHISKGIAREETVKKVYAWQVSSSDAEHILWIIKPFLIIKLLQCEVALRFRERVRSRVGRGKSLTLTEEERQLRNALKEEMTVLNKRGTSEKE